jgi:hypothetical protein
MGQASLHSESNAALFPAFLSEQSACEALLPREEEVLQAHYSTALSENLCSID